MPARSNDFQAVVYFIRSHVDADAVVTESAMLPDRTGAGLREVDVLITSRARDGRQVRIGVECRDHAQKPDITWVEQVVTKQADLELDQMVMVSSSGFTAGAVAKARYYGIELVTPERPIPADGPLGRLGQPHLEFRDLIRERLISVSGQVSRNGDSQTIPLPAGAAVFDAEGIALCSVAELVGIFLDGADLREVVAQAPGQSVELRVQVSDFVLRRDEGGDPIEVFIGTRDGQLLRLTDFDAVLGARVEARPVLLAAAELQGTAYAVGAGHVGDNRALVIFSDSPAGERMSVRVTDADGQVSDWIADRSTQTLRPHTSPADPEVNERT
ncbi:restriction endonuclease [Nonomuraea spiralis]|uniref:Restriction endonuclease n=1 Tax=Nonomuraea spiralis TaxID=46182 RepID=A0ABV5IRP6_9ACTN|nr:restriction endonuclease [Nonomuraea spiralis]